MRRSAVLVVLVLLMGLAVAWSQQPRDVERAFPTMQGEHLVLLKPISERAGAPVGTVTIYLPLLCPTRDTVKLP